MDGEYDGGSVASAAVVAFGVMFSSNVVEEDPAAGSIALVAGDDACCWCECKFV